MDQTESKIVSNMESAGQTKKAKRLVGPLFIGLLLMVVFFFGYAFALQTTGAVVSNQAFVLPSGSSNLIPEFDADLYAQVYTQLQNNYVDTEDLDDKELFYGALRGMVDAVGDPYTAYFDPETNKEFNLELSGQFEGIGAEIGIREERLTIIAPLAGSPAESAGLRPQDTILAIDGLDTFGMGLDEAISLIRGEAGTEVVLTIYRDSELGGTEDITVVRDVITIPTVETEIRDGIAIVSLYNFNSESEAQFIDELISIRNQNVRGLILDLRSNPGGFLDKSVNIASAWVPEGEIVVREIFRDSRFNQAYKAVPQIQAPNVPTVVLVNEGSASASEILAGALQDYELATIIGSTTFGKGSVQDLRSLSDGSGLKVTIAQWITPAGQLIDKTGIEPDIEVELTLEQYLNDEDPQLDAAIEFINNQ